MPQEGIPGYRSWRVLDPNALDSVPWRDYFYRPTSFGTSADSPPLDFFRLNETSGTQAANSGNWTVSGAHFGTISGGVTLGVPGAIADDDFAMRFDGTSGKIAATYSTSFLLHNACYCIWVRTTNATGSTFPALSVRDGSSHGLFLGMSSNKAFLYDGGNQVFSLGPNINDGNWHWLVALYKLDPGLVNAHWELNVDAQRIGTCVWPNADTTGTTLNIGWDLPNNTFWPGDLDEVVVTANPFNAWSVDQSNTGQRKTVNKLYKAATVIPGQVGVVNPNLHHSHRSSYQVRSLQQGITGSASVGTFTIVLPGPGTDEWRQHQDDYYALKVGQKVEAYASEEPRGTPVYSGVITKIDRPLDGDWTISGSDTLWWLQQSQLFTGENRYAYQGHPSSDLIRNFLGTRELVFDDDFSVNTGKWSVETGVAGTYTTDPLYGLPAYRLAGGEVFYNDGSGGWSMGEEFQVDYQGTCQVTAWGVLQPNLSVSNAGEIALEVCWNGSYSYFGEVAAVCTNASGPYSWNITAQLWYRDGGSFIQLAGVTAFSVTSLSSAVNIPVQVAMVNDALGYWRVVVNGQDVGCYNPTSSPLDANAQVGTVGIRSTGGGPSYINRIRWEARTANSWLNHMWSADRFLPGNIVDSPRTISPYVFSGAGQSHLDMLLMGSSYDNYYIRKAPGAGTKADRIDYGPTPGVDRSNQIVFEEGVNVVADGTLVAPIADIYATTTRLQAPPNGQSGGQVESPIKQNVGDMVVQDSVSDIGFGSYSLLTTYARVLSSRKSNPMTATQVQAIRTADIADVVRELDYVTVHLPTERVYHQKVLVVGYDFTEGESTQTYYLTDVPDKTMVANLSQRLVSSNKFMLSTYKNR